MKTAFFTMLLILSVSSVYAESPREIHYSFQKGNVADFLLLSLKSDSNDQLKQYFSQVFPIAKAAGYQPLPSLKVSKSPLQGNYHPNALAIASWPDKKSKKQAMTKIENSIKGFHQSRRDIWSSFNVTSYEVQQDMSITLSTDKSYVLTAYWSNNQRDFNQFKKRWLATAEDLGGVVKLTLENGSSEFGYHYSPDFMTITEWVSPEDFDRFYTENLKMDHTSAKHVNQFFLELPAAKKNK